MRLLAVGVWASLVATASSYAAGYWIARHGKVAGTDETFQGLEYKKTRAVNVPVIANGSVQGYVVAQFVYTIDSKVAKTLSVPPDAFILDEAFRAIYAEEKLDFRKLGKVDLSRLAKDIVARVDGRIGGEIVKTSSCRNSTMSVRRMSDDDTSARRMSADEAAVSLSC